MLSRLAGGHNTRVSLAALIATRPGHPVRLIYRTRTGHGKDQRKGFTETDYARFLDAAHQQLGGPLVVVWDGLKHPRQPRDARAGRRPVVAEGLPAPAGTPAS